MTLNSVAKGFLIRANNSVCKRSGVRLVPICFITSRSYTFPALKLGRLSYVSLHLVLYIWLKVGVFAPAEGAICVMILPPKVGHAPCFVYVFSRVALLEPL